MRGQDHQAGGMQELLERRIEARSEIRPRRSIALHRIGAAGQDSASRGSAGIGMRAASCRCAAAASAGVSSGSMLSTISAVVAPARAGHCRASASVRSSRTHAAQVRAMEIAERQDRRTSADQRAKRAPLARLVAQARHRAAAGARMLLIGELREIARRARAPLARPSSTASSAATDSVRAITARLLRVGQSGMPSCGDAPHRVVDRDMRDALRLVDPATLFSSRHLAGDEAAHVRARDRSAAAGRG